jgi:hypothetical protein
MFMQCVKKSSLIYEDSKVKIYQGQNAITILSKKAKDKRNLHFLNPDSKEFITLRYMNKKS